MSWREPKTLRVALAAFAITGLVSGCQVRPLYADAASQSTGETRRVASVAIKPVTTREAQEVRNQLIFLFNGGAGEPDDPRYNVNLGVAASTTAALTTQIADTDDYVPTASTVTMSSLYTIADTATGETVASGKREVSASYDRPRQEFAALRAERDAQNRAARELAQALNLAILQDLAKLGQ